MNLKDLRLTKFETELKLRGFSERTIYTYLYQVQRFLLFIKKEPKDIELDDVKLYLAYLVSDKKLAPSSLILAKASIRFLLEEVMGKTLAGLKTPKNTKRLPVVLSKEEVRRLINAAGSKREKMIVTLLYSSGIRLSEALNLKYEDVEPKEQIGWVRKGKGSKDRMFLLSDRFVRLLGKELTKRNGFIFIGHEGKRLSPRGVQNIIKRIALKAGLSKEVHPHTLRHCFATHLLESGVGIRQIQELLGHSNLQTTQIYTKVSTEELRKIKSPIDNIY